MSDAMSRTPLDHDIMRSTRLHLATSKRQRQFATAMFPLCVARVADDLRQIVMGQGAGDDALRSADYLESRIRDEYRRWFGCEMGAGSNGE